MVKAQIGIKQRRAMTSFVLKYHSGCHPESILRVLRVAEWKLVRRILLYPGKEMVEIWTK